MTIKKPDETPKPKGQIVHDAELVAMQQISKVLNKLNEGAKLRVIAWLKSKAEFPLDPGK